MKEQRLFSVGNGRLGAMIYGSVPEAKFQLNEESIWSGKHLVPHCKNNSVYKVDKKVTRR